MTQLIEVSLSSSHFRDHAWKALCLSFADQVLVASGTSQSPDALVLQARVLTQRAVLSGLFASTLHLHRFHLSPDNA